MLQKLTGIESTYGSPEWEAQQAFDHQIEMQYPGAGDIFRQFLHLSRAPEDIYEDIIDARTEFPMAAAIAVPDSKGRFQVISISGNDTNGPMGSLGHAETLAIKHALKGEKHLPKGAVLFTKVEPCSMCAGGLHHCGGDTIVFGATQGDIRGMSAYVDRENKPFRTEPEGYDVEAYMKARNPDAIVIGGFRRAEVLHSLTR